MKVETIFVLAGSYSEFKQFLREKENGLYPADYRYADHAEKLMGHRGATYITYGTFYERSDAHKIEEFAKRYLPDSNSTKI